MFFRGLLNKIKKRRPMLASRMGGFLRQRPQLMERMRNLRGMRGMGRNMMMPGMGIGSLPNMPSRDVNDLPLPDRSSDIMPRDGMMPKQPPQLGMATQMPGVPPRGSGLPPMPNPMMDMQGRRFMKDGGGVDPNPGITALRKEAPEVVERMGYQEGGAVPGIDMPSGSDADMMNYQNTLMALRKLKESLPSNQQVYFDSAVQEILGESGRTISNQDREILKKRVFDEGMSDMQKRKLAGLRGLAGGAGLGPGVLKVPPRLRVD
tara:strand:- start:5 stop:793 length:789 start_codon:yes stop_codon:yes gene_type:complete